MNEPSDSRPAKKELWTPPAKFLRLPRPNLDLAPGETSDRPDRRREIVQDLERRSRERRLEGLRGGFRAAISGIDGALAASREAGHHEAERRSISIDPVPLRPTTFAGARGQAFVKQTRIVKKGPHKVRRKRR